MRCPRCNVEFNARSERCPNCGTSAKLAKPDGDTMTRVRRHIATVRGDKIEQTENELHTSFSPVMKFDKPADAEFDESTAGLNPSENFTSTEFRPVDLTDFFSKDGDDAGEIYSEGDVDEKHKVISAKIRYMVSNKDDDLLADYYFDDGISDLERYQLDQSYAKLEQSENPDNAQAAAEISQTEIQVAESQPPQMSESAKRLSQFPEEEGADKIFTRIGEKFDALAVKCKDFFSDLIHNKIGKVYRKFDAKTAPFLNVILDKYYYIKFKGLKRKINDNDAEKSKLRKGIWSVCGVLAVMAVCLVIFVASLFTDGVTGKWVVSYDSSGSPNIITEFTASGKTIVSVKSDDGWHVHKQGTYKTRRKNGHDMLEITYEDGTVTRLYYTIDGKEGTFRNVETNVESVYTLK